MARVRLGGVRSRTRLAKGGSVTVEGFSEVYAGLKQLTRATERNTLKRAATKAMQPTLELAKNYAPVKTGKLRNSIHLSVGIDDPDFRARARASFAATGSAKGVKRTKGGGQLLAQVRAGGNAAPHASRIELGTVRITAHPFLRPAFDDRQRDIIDTLRDTLKVEVRKALQRRARKLAKAAAG
jgi:HK97 gp10 family phage protein